jgi:hypothetical protein
MPNPTHQLAANDSGAETLRNFQYQCAYGVILLTSAILKTNDYRAVWCEQEDDLLAEIDDNKFDSFQVKTQAPEYGHWDVGKKGFIKAISVFAHLEASFPGSIRWFNFVSNALLLDSTDPKLAHKCPALLAEEVQKAKVLADLKTAHKKIILKLSKAAKQTEETIFAVFKRLRFAQSPSRDSFIAELAANHLPLLEPCKTASIPKIKRAVRNVISLVEEASSLASQAPSRHYACLTRGDRNDPQLLMKRVCIQKFEQSLNEIIKPGFRYIPAISESDFARTDRDFQRFAKKLKKGGIEFYADTLRNQATTAEAILLEIATRGPEGKSLVDHLRVMVKAECDLAHLQASKTSEPYGSEMLRTVSNNFIAMATNDPGKACQQPHEVLLGMAAILTEDCKVWWSPRFTIEEVP